MKKNQVAAVFVAFLVYSSTTSAVTVTESTDFGLLYLDSTTGTFSTVYNSSIGVLDIGANSVSGSLSGTCQGGFTGSVPCNLNMTDDNTDSFLIEIPDGYKLDTLFLTTSNASGPQDFNGGSAIISINTGFASYLSTGGGPVLNSTTPEIINLITPTLNANGISQIDAGVYGMGVTAGSATQEGAFSLDYMLEMNVAPVPIPAAAWLFGSALLGLVGIGRRRSLN